MGKFQTLWIVCLVGIIGFVTTEVSSKGLLVPEYSPQKTTFLTLTAEDNKTLHFERLSRIMAVLQSKNVPITVFVPQNQCEKLVTSRPVVLGLQLNDNERKRGIIAQLEQRAGYHCGREYGSCLIPRTKYICVPEHSKWLRNTFPLETIDETNQQPLRFSVGRPGDIVPILTGLGEKIDKIPIQSNGPASFATDRLGGNLYISTDLIQRNPKLTERQIEDILRKYLSFKKLVWIEPNPWEQSRDLDTVLMFSRSKDGNIHAFLAVHPEVVFRTAKKGQAYDFLTAPFPMKEELSACESIQAFVHDDTSDLCWDLAIRDDDSVRNRWRPVISHRTRESFDSYLRRVCPRLNELRSCIENVSIEKHRLAWKIDQDNFKKLLESGFSPDRIHRIQNAGIYQVGETIHDTQVTTYVNGLIVEDRYILPTYPSMQDIDAGLDRSEIREVEREFLEMSAQDSAAYNQLSPFFDRVIPIRSDGITGGAIHCTTFSYYK